MAIEGQKKAAADWRELCHIFSIYLFCECDSCLKHQVWTRVSSGTCGLSSCLSRGGKDMEQAWMPLWNARDLCKCPAARRNGKAKPKVTSCLSRCHFAFRSVVGFKLELDRTGLRGGMAWTWCDLLSCRLSLLRCFQQARPPRPCLLLQATVGVRVAFAVFFDIHESKFH